MEPDFREPTLETEHLIGESAPRDTIRKHLLDRLCINLYKKYIEDGILEYNKQDLEFMKTEISKKLKELESSKQSDPENESHVFDVDKKICQFYAQIFEVEKFEALSKEITEKDPSITLKFDILMCKIRMAIVLRNRSNLVKYFEQAKIVFEESSDWDRKNRFKVYLGLFHMMKAELRTAAEYFCDSLASFDATEFLPFDKVILYLVFTSLITFERCDLREKVIGNPEVRKCKEFLSLPECLFKCEYGEFFKNLLRFISHTDGDVFLEPFRELFCKEMKIKGYYQMLLCYQSVHLVRMAECFGVEPDHVEEDLRNFISEGKINCVIDRVDGVVRMRLGEKVEDLQLMIKTGESMIRDMMKTLGRMNSR